MLLNEIHQGGIRALIAYDDTIFNNMVLPTGVSLQDVVDHIFFKYGDAPLFSPSPEVMKYYIGEWSRRRLPLWNRYKAVIDAEYDPLRNYDRTEQIELTHGKKTTYAGSVDDGVSGSYTDTITNEISADNASTYQPDNKSTNDHTFNQYKNTTTFNNRSDTNSGKDVTAIHAFGNIGVTTSQQMAVEELNLIPRLDLIDYIADDWHAEFCLSIY